MKNKKISALIIGAAILAAGAGTIPANAQTQTPSNTTKEYVTAIKVQAVKGHKDLPSKQNIDSNKTFAIQFNTEIDFSTVSRNNVKVTDKTGSTVPVTLKLKEGNSKILLVEAPKGGYKSGENYTLNIYEGIKTKKGKGLGHTVTMKFTVKSNDSGSETEIPTNRDSMDVIIGTLKGKRSYDMSSGNDYKKLSAWNSSRTTEQMQEMFNVKNYYDYENSIVTFLNKYKNSKYRDITDLDYYKKLPNLTINFDNVNNSNEYSVSYSYDSTLTHYFGKSFRDFDDINYQAVTVAPSNMRGTDIWYATVSFLRDYKTKHREGVFVWRTDVEKEMLDEINKRRKEKGMNPLKLDNDLIAMAKHSAKLSQLGFSHNSMFVKPLPLTGGTNKLWARGSVPYAYKNTSDKDSYIDVVNFEDNAKRMFGYNKEVKAISEATAIYTNGKEILNAWEMKGNIFSDEWSSLNYYDDRVKDVPYGISKERFDMPIKLEENIYNPNMKTIGIGCVHEPPISEIEFNGSLGVFIVTSK
ncbi:CAP domain-containing protein [Clostridium brassicae]|uniref:CAP domain-containing protein n=1 Tax=Clostridium brassicae TaxID=2999072 RepID=A0ABT4DAT8_9CLOT|nr:CAP domain-containing protein [Clostridium brassicae]MCY6959424.1 CAP domain-containing protein [Clostridium brassicae]